MSNKTKSSKPAYQQIKDSILQSIHSGKWQAGDAIPTEYKLAEQFSVSRMTVNRALKELSDDKVLERRQGSGTYVAQQQYNHTVVEVRNIAADIRATGKQYAAQIISQRRVKVSEVSPRILAMLTEPMLDNNDTQTTWGRVHEPAYNPTLNTEYSSIVRHSNDELYEVELIHIADGVPIQFEQRWVDAALVPHFIEQDFTVINTSDYLIQQAPLQGGSYTIRAVAAPKDVANALNMPVDDPALLLTRQTYSADRVVTFVKMWHAGHSYQFSGVL